jgi:hypothetical protein
MPILGRARGMRSSFCHGGRAEVGVGQKLVGILPRLFLCEGRIPDQKKRSDRPAQLFACTAKIPEINKTVEGDFLCRAKVFIGALLQF